MIGTCEPSSLPLASLSTGQVVQVPKVFFLTQNGMKLAAVWEGPSSSMTLALFKANAGFPYRHWGADDKGTEASAPLCQETLGSGQITEVAKD